MPEVNRHRGFTSIRKSVRSHQRETGRKTVMQMQSTEWRRWGLQRLPRIGSLFWHLTEQWPQLSLSISSDKSVFSWPRLPLMALASLRLNFFCSSIQRSSEHSSIRCWPPPSPSWPTYTQQPVLSLPGTTAAFPSPLTLSFLVLDWVAGWPLFCVPFGVHS